MDPFKKHVIEKENDAVKSMFTGIPGKAQEIAQDDAEKEKTIKSTPKSEKALNGAKSDKKTIYYDFKQYKPTKDDNKMIPFRLNYDGATLLKGIAQRYDTSVNNIIISALETYTREFIKEEEIKEIKKYKGIK